MKSTLSIAASVVVRAVEAVNGFYDDPITVHYGMGSELGPEVVRTRFLRAKEELAKLGWTPNQVEDAMEQRVSPKWIYESGLNQFFDYYLRELA